MSEHLDLQHLIEAWPSLSEEIKERIVRLMESSKE